MANQEQNMKKRQVTSAKKRNELKLKKYLEKREKELEKLKAKNNG